jgi:thiamine-phosphate pyrophosphorylase
MALVLPRGLYGMLDLPAKGLGGAGASRPLPPRLIYEPLFAAAVPILQLRYKGGSAAAMLEVLQELMRNRPAGTRLVVNDRIDVALAGGADGVHLGQDDLPLSAARRIAQSCGRPDFFIGISTHNEEQAAAALAGGADYIAFGPIFPTNSKENPDPTVGLARLAALCEKADRPVVAIGGISLERVPAIVAAGAHCAALISAVDAAPDVHAAALKVQACFRSC